jgi:hypothetical protein
MRVIEGNGTALTPHLLSKLAYRDPDPVAFVMSPERAGQFGKTVIAGLDIRVQRGVPRDRVLLVDRHGRTIGMITNLEEVNAS